MRAVLTPGDGWREIAPVILRVPKDIRGLCTEAAVAHEEEHNNEPLRLSTFDMAAEFAALGINPELAAAVILNADHNPLKRPVASIVLGYEFGQKLRPAFVGATLNDNPPSDWYVARVDYKQQGDCGHGYECCVDCWHEWAIDYDLAFPTKHDDGSISYTYGFPSDDGVTNPFVYKEPE